MNPEQKIKYDCLLYIMEEAFETLVAIHDDPYDCLHIVYGDRTIACMDALDKFDGTTITFVDTEAISAGSYIAIATDDIYFAPKGIMGAAEAVTGTGEDIAEGMQRKINSYLRAKVRMLAESQRYRGDVQRAT